MTFPKFPELRPFQRIHEEISAEGLLNTEKLILAENGVSVLKFFDLTD